MAIDYGPFKAKLDPDGAVMLVIRAGPDPAVTCNAALFRPNPRPPDYVAVRNPFWDPARTTSNVLPPVIDVFSDDGESVSGQRLVVLVGLSVLAPSPDPAFKYTATIEVKQKGTARASVLVALTKAQLDAWHKFAFDFE